MLGKKRAMWVACAVVFAGVSACGDDGGQAGLGTAGCLSDQQICQFQKGVSTEMDVQKALGNAQQYLGANTWAYFCQQIVGQQAVHNDIVVFDFSDSGVLSDVTVLRMGTGATPPPKCDMAATSSSSSDPACSSVPLPAPDTTACQGLTLGGSSPVMTNCMDQNGDKWSSTCSAGTCSCSYNDVYACNCSVPSGKNQCCPGL